MLYDRALRECSVLKASIARECRLQSMQNNINRARGNRQTEGDNANGNFSYWVTLKPAVSP